MALLIYRSKSNKLLFSISYTIFQNDEAEQREGAALKESNQAKTCPTPSRLLQRRLGVTAHLALEYDMVSLKVRGKPR